ncbi:MAG: oligosaccharide flippase family protein [Thermomicrobiales bacterium]
MKTTILQIGSTITSRLLAGLLQGAMLVLIARATSPHDFGLLSIAIGVGMFAQTALDLGIVTFLLVERASDRGSKLLSGALAWNSRTSLFLGGVACLAIVAVSTFSGATTLVLLPLAIWIGAERNAEACLAIVYADGDWIETAANLVIRRAISLALLIALLGLNVQPLLAFSIAWGLASLTGAIIARVRIASLIDLGDSLSFSQLLSHTAPYWATTAAMNSNTLDSLVVGAVAGTQQSGLFSISSRLTNPLRIIPTSVARAILPLAARRRASGESSGPLYVLIALTIGSMSFIYILLMLGAPYFVPRLLGEDFRQAIVPLQIVLAGLPLASGVSIFNAVLQGEGNKVVVSRIAVICAVLYLVALVPGSIAFGAIGAAATLSLSYTVQLAALAASFLWFRRKSCRVTTEKRESLDVLRGDTVEARQS